MSTLAYQGAALEHIIETARRTGHVDEAILQGARDARVTIAFFERHEELTKAYHKLWKENKEMAKAMSEVGRHFPGSWIAQYRELYSDDNYEISRDA